MLFTTEFWKDTTIRALKTWAQAGIALLGSSAFGLFTVDWVNFLSVTLGAAFVSLLTSLSSVDTVGAAGASNHDQTVQEASTAANTAEPADTTDDDVDALGSTLPDTPTPAAAAEES